MALLRPGEITQIVRVGLGFEACFSCLRIPVSLCSELSSAFPRLRYLGPLWFPRISWTRIFFFFFSYTFSLPLPAICSPPDADRAVKEREWSFCVFKYKLRGLTLGQFFCLLVLHLPPCPLQPRPILFKFPAIPPHLTLHLESEDVRASNRVSAEVIDSSHREFSCLYCQWSWTGSLGGWARHVNSPWLSCQGEARHTREWVRGKTVEQIIVLLERKGVKNISAQELAVWKRTRSRRNPCCGF